MHNTKRIPFQCILALACVIALAWLLLSPLAVAESRSYADCKVGDMFSYGHYAQGPEGEGAPIEWIVWRRTSTMVYALAREGLAARSFNEGERRSGWEVSDLRRWLNCEFLQAAFSEPEAANLVKCDYSSHRAINAPAPVGETILSDYVYILSAQEVEEVPADWKTCAPTQRALAQGAAMANGIFRGCWWTRTRDMVTNNPAYVDISGRICSDLRDNCAIICVRPAICLRVSQK